jgi:hypothetical protein
VSPEPDPAAAVERSSLRGAVRAALAIPVNRRPDRLLAWLEEAEQHDREPSKRVVNVPPAVREALAAWAADAPDDSAA